MFIGRRQELEAFERLYNADKFALFILYGRRRVGKTTLLKEFCKNKPYIFYSAEQSTDKLNLEKFSQQIFQHYGEHNLSTFADWSNAFSYLSSRQRKERIIVILDEFPYLAQSNKALLSELQHLIDHDLQQSKLFLVLCGSYMGFMEKEILGAKSPIFGRRTGQLQLKPFDYLASSGFMQEMSLTDKLLAYSIFGGTAMYLQLLDAGQSLRENIARLFLESSGYLYEEPLLLLRQELENPGVYYAIIEAIAGGASKSAEIAAKTGEEQAKCLKYIAVLRALGLVYAEIPLGEKPNSRRTQYFVADPMLRFWFRYVAGNKTLLETGAQNIVWEKRIEPDLNNYMGHAFEKICREYLLRKNSIGALPLLFTKIGRWWGTGKRMRRQVEIDLVAQDGSSCLLGECKWRNEKLDYHVLEELRYKADVFGAAGERWFIFFSKSGFTKAVEEAAAQDEHILLVGIPELFS